MERARSFSSLVNELNQKLAQPMLLAIDGPAGSGKTTFANSLNSHLSNSVVVNMDEIYNGWEDALSQSLVDNLLNWIITPFKANETIEYPVFDWYKYCYQNKKTIRPNTSIILEGVGVGSAQLLTDLDFLIWIEAADEVGLTRVKNRDGETVANHMAGWRKAEALWFSQNQTKANAQLLVQGDPPISIDIANEFWPI